ncbi:FH1 FH2 domain-containing 3 isoform X1, partial [Brachionus plicatilis]
MSSNTFSCRIQYLNDSNPFVTSNFPEPTRPPSYPFLISVPLSNQLASVHSALNAPLKIEDCTLQIYRQNGTEAEYGAYLDLDQSLDEHSEELELLRENKRATVLLRTQLSVRVHTCIEKILNSRDGELRRSLFLLKQLFQNDKDLVHEFVNKDGLECLVKVANDTKEHNYINYILRALGQLMLFVDGMNGVIKSNETVQWLYSVLSSGFRLVMKTSLKLLIVFVEYAERNALLLTQAVDVVDGNRKLKPWCNIMAILGDLSNQDDLELILYSMILINTVLNAIPDQDTFYDVSDSFEEQGMQQIIQHYFKNPVKHDDTGCFKQIVQQMELYE